MKAMAMVLVIMMLSIPILNVQAREMDEIPMMNQDKIQEEQVMQEYISNRESKVVMPENVEYNFDYSLEDLKDLPSDVINNAKEKLNAMYNDLRDIEKSVIDNIKNIIDDFMN